MVRNARGRMQPPINDIEDYWSPAEKAHVGRMLACSFHGSPATVRDKLTAFIARAGADELMITAQIYDHQARLRSYEIAAQAREALAREQAEAAPAQ